MTQPATARIAMMATTLAQRYRGVSRQKESKAMWLSETAIVQITNVTLSHHSHQGFPQCTEADQISGNVQIKPTIVSTKPPMGVILARRDSSAAPQTRPQILPAATTAAVSKALQSSSQPVRICAVPRNAAHTTATMCKYKNIRRKVN